MIRSFKLFVLFFCIVLSIPAIADEGMWIPMLLGKYNIADMQKKGFKLTAEDIYSINNASMKDAVMIFGGGCTGELISNNGLVITNHHCGYGAIQSQSSLEHDYLTDGFWAKSNKEELSAPNLSVTFLVYMEDVTQKVLANVTNNMSEIQRKSNINSEIEKIKKSVSLDNNYQVVIKPFYYGNEYYMFVYEVFNDVRLVGAPPSSIGKFGGDTDNWMWPRHTGDFSLFRIYADKNNKSAKYSPDNIPFKPKKYFTISLKGYKQNDFTMVLGYPGSTSEYITSYAVKMITEKENPAQIKLREKRLEIMQEFMNKDNKVRIQYASKYAGVANYWKKWIGENRGLQRSNTLEKKYNLEKDFNSWVNQDESKKLKYSGLLKDYNNIYKDFSPYSLALDFVYEAFYSVEIIKFSGKFIELSNINLSDTIQLKQTIVKLKNSSNAFFKDYYLPIDKKTFSALLKMYYDNIDKSFYPDIYNFVDKKFKNNFDDYAEYVFSKSFLTSKEKVNDFLYNVNAKSLKKLSKDPAFQLAASISNLVTGKISDKYFNYNSKIDSLNRIYITGLREMQKDKIFYPDANFTLRVAYGNIDSYYPNDAVKYDYFTTLDGIIEKENPDIYDYKVPAKLKELYLKKEYGNYAENGIMHVCFIAKNHTTGGNSGSPVLNADGQLIGINFDRNWEGTMSDIMYNPDLCRNIALDIRYVMFIVDKFAGASNLINEMTFVNK